VRKLAFLGGRCDRLPHSRQRVTSFMLVLFALACEWASAGSRSRRDSISSRAAWRLSRCECYSRMIRSANDVVPPVVFSRGEEIHGNARAVQRKLVLWSPGESSLFRGSLLQARCVKYARRDLCGGPSNGHPYRDGNVS
jgi:hypothetical protein